MSEEVMKYRKKEINERKMQGKSFQIMEEVVAGMERIIILCLLVKPNR